MKLIEANILLTIIIKQMINLMKSIDPQLIEQNRIRLNY